MRRRCFARIGACAIATVLFAVMTVSSANAIQRDITLHQGYLCNLFAMAAIKTWHKRDDDALIEAFDLVTNSLNNETYKNTLQAKNHVKWLPLKEMPQLLVDAFISEANSFSSYSNFSINTVTPRRVTIDDVFETKSIKGTKLDCMRMPSHITRQLVVSSSYAYSSKTLNKNLFHGHGVHRNTNLNIISSYIEMSGRVDPRIVLEHYVNGTYYGLAAFGIAAASEKYFDKAPIKLTLPEIAYLVALIKAPNQYHPIRKAEMAVKRRNWLINVMLKDGIISKHAADAALEAPLGVVLAK